MRKKEKDDLLKQIVEGAITGKDVMGFSFMDGLPKSVDKIRGKGINVEDRQQLRSLRYRTENDSYAVYLVDVEKNGKIWCVWRLVPGKISYGVQTTKLKWVGMHWGEVPDAD